jgi:hypothetical protein
MRQVLTVFGVKHILALTERASNEVTYREFCGIVSRWCPSIPDASTDHEKGSAIPASNVAHSILEALGLAEIGHPRLNSAKPSSFLEWQLFCPMSLTIVISIRCLTLPQKGVLATHMP